MYKNPLIVLVVLNLLFGGIFLVFGKNKNNAGNNVVCTMEAKICPDGSAVGRVGPNCEFAECPTTSSAVKAKNNGYLTGRVTISPTCPVEKVPPDPQCAPKPYPSVVAIRSGGFFIQVHADSNGMFWLELPPNTYIVEPYISGTLYPHCQSVEGVVKVNSTTTVDISCDSGIR